MFHISLMSDEHETAPETLAPAASWYRVRVPDGQTPPPKSVENAADSSAKGQTEDGAKPGDSPKEIGGPKGPEPTRFGDWERDGRCVDF